MLVHIVCRPLTITSHIPQGEMRFLAEALRAGGIDIIDDVAAIPSGDISSSAEACAQELSQRWADRRPDLVHAVGVVATMAAVRTVGQLPADRRVPIVATFDEKPVSDDVERGLAERVTALLPLSCAERDRWRHERIRTLWSGAFPFPIQVPDSGEVPSAGGDVVTLATGSDLDAVLESMRHWSGRLTVAARLTPERISAVHSRADELGVTDRIDLCPGLRGRDREQMWARAAMVLAGSQGSRHAGQVLEAAAHAVPAIAVAEDAHLDHVVPMSTGLLLEPGAPARTWGRAIASLLEDTFHARSLGASALLRVDTVNTPQVTAQRLAGLYAEIVDERDAAASPAPADEPSAEHEPLRTHDERDTLAMTHLPLARQLAGWYTGRGQSRDDLVQVASLGLVRAAERFDPAHGKEFHSFAIPTILGELRKHFRDHAWAVRVPRGLQETTMAVHKATEAVRQAVGHEPSAVELATELGMTEEEVVLALRADGEARWTHSLDHPVGDAESVADLVGECDSALDLVELRRDVHKLLEVLPEREQQILLMRFFGERTQSEIAARLGISQVHVSRVLSRTLAALREHVLNDEPLPVSWQRASGATQTSARTPTRDTSDRAAEQAAAVTAPRRAS
ncbi:MAG: SigB/SigF/SigG family RNA polymerase sigma factor [Candidatus Nanopelagicales bacterium]